ncbi:hypothetical protein [Sphingorhabdus sp. Alg239-R122]|uniref:hypothetical protein n=1 Tax=Sphingorhabdus sp. Alg239-R122 TaxID=2305989 RepID=UPI0013DC38AB|nr:hypothetical protein [Sphingorhabdus sp. Alg239-R122]
MTDLFFADLVRERSFAPGAGSLALEGALPGHRRFEAVVPAGAQFHYVITGVSHPHEWETGMGNIDGAGRLVRSPLASSNDGAATNFSGGLKTVALTVAADWFTGQQAAEYVPQPGSTVALGAVRDSADLPADYPPGLSVETAGSGFPFAGQVVTLRHSDGSGYQRNIGTTAYGAQRQAMRHMTASGWGLWDGVQYAPTLINGWAPHASFTADPHYMRDPSGRVHLSGTIAGGQDTNNSVFFSLPSGFRPGSQHYFTCRSGGSNVGVYVRSNGDVVLQSGPASWISLSGISFAAER